jgi:hypothetical protein
MAALKFGAWLRRVERSPYADRLVLRGSLVTRRFFPSRKCEDVDHLLLDGSAGELQRAADAVIAVPDEESLEIVAREKLWPDTALPGHRTVFANGIQVDIGFGDPITVAPERMTDATWGTSRGSRNRWKRFRRDEVPAAPALPDAIAKLRARFAGVVRSVE